MDKKTSEDDRQRWMAWRGIRHVTQSRSSLGPHLQFNEIKRTFKNNTEQN